MPIYAYRCTTCGHAQDVLRKISDPPLNVCPACGAATFAKQVTAAGFQLKGSGWYVTDFRDRKAAKPAESDSAGKAPAGETAANGDAKPANGSAASEAAKPAAAPAKSEAAPAAAPASAPAPASTPDKGKA
jgi:putative FmdB family regulatory protein